MVSTRLTGLGARIISDQRSEFVWILADLEGDEFFVEVSAAELATTQAPEVHACHTCNHPARGLIEELMRAGCSLEEIRRRIMAMGMWCATHQAMSRPAAMSLDALEAHRRFGPSRAAQVMADARTGDVTVSELASVHAECVLAAAGSLR